MVGTKKCIAFWDQEPDAALDPKGQKAKEKKEVSPPAD